MKRKRVVSTTEWVEGIVAELESDEELMIVCRKYVLENGQLNNEGIITKIDFIEVMLNKTKKRIPMIAKKIGTRNFYIDENLYNILMDNEDEDEDEDEGYDVECKKYVESHDYDGYGRDYEEYSY